MKTQFVQSEDGLTTVEWVSLAAILFLFALGISTFVMESADGLGGAVAGRLDATAEQIAPEEGGEAM